MLAYNNITITAPTVGCATNQRTNTSTTTFLEPLESCRRTTTNNSGGRRRRRATHWSSAGSYMKEPVGRYAYYTFSDLEASGPAVEPLPFPALAATAFATCQEQHIQARDPLTGHVQDCHGVLVLRSHSNYATTSTRRTVAYWPRRELQKAIYGSVWVYTILVPRGTADNYASIVEWEITSEQVAIKKLNRHMIRQWQGRHAEDPLKEIAAMYMLNEQQQQFEQQQRQRQRHHYSNSNTQSSWPSSHVLTCSDVWQDDHHLYSIMPYCSRGDLYNVVHDYMVASQQDLLLSSNDDDDSTSSLNNMTMPESVARYLFRQVMQGLHTLQKHGICHRDLSLENILVTDDWQCHIMDLGMCLRVPYSSSSSGKPQQQQQQVITDVTHGSLRRLMTPQVTCGKWRYMSPEVKANREAMDGHAVDLWAAGVILYSMLMGFPPYEQPVLTDERYRLLAEGYLIELLHEWDISLSTAAEDLLFHMLQPDPRQRFSLAQVLEHPWMTQGPVEAPHEVNVAAAARQSVPGLQWGHHNHPDDVDDDDDLY